MSNVVPLLRPRPAPDAAALGRPRTEAERTVQMVLDAVTSIERALDTITDGGDYTPF